jgi:uridine kinase
LSPPNPPELLRAAAILLGEIRRRLVNHTTPLLVALDGGSGAGKSTLAQLIAAELDAAHIPSDDFFAAELTDADWAARSPAARAADAIDWRRLRTAALLPLLAGQPARWRGFDFMAGLRPDGSYPMQTFWTVRDPAPLIILDGAYSSRPELADLIDLSVLVDVPLAVRHQRLVAREPADFLAAWHARWDEAEAYYFAHIRPRDTFDLVITTGE